MCPVAPKPSDIEGEGEDCEEINSPNVIQNAADIMPEPCLSLPTHRARKTQVLEVTM